MLARNRRFAAAEAGEILVGAPIFYLGGLGIVFAANGASRVGYAGRACVARGWVVRNKNRRMPEFDANGLATDISPRR